MGEFAIGQPVSRLEDPRLLKGLGRYIDDLDLPGQAYACILRSPYAHARIRAIDAGAATAMPGVLGVLTGADCEADGLGHLPCDQKRFRRDGSDMYRPPRPVRGDGHDGDHMPLQLRDARRQAGQNLDRIGVEESVHAETGVVREVGRVAKGFVRVAGGPDEDGFFGRAGLGQRGDRVAEIVAELLRGILLDVSGEPHARIDEIERPPAVRPGGHFVDYGGPSIVGAGQAGQRNRGIGRVDRAAERNREHRDIGAPGDAAPGSHQAEARGGRSPRDDAGDRRAVRHFVAGLVGGSGDEAFGHPLPGKDRVSGIDAAVDQADGLAAAGCGAAAVPDFDLRIGPFRPDRAQPPLIVQNAARLRSSSTAAGRNQRCRDQQVNEDTECPHRSTVRAWHPDPFSARHPIMSMRIYWDAYLIFPCTA